MTAGAPGGVVVAAASGWLVAALLLAPSLAPVPAGTALVGVAAGMGAGLAARDRGRRTRAAVTLLVPVLSVLVVGRLLLVPVDLAVPVGFALVSAAAALTHGRRAAVRTGAGLVATAAVAATATAGAWSVDEPAADDPAMVAGNGIVVARDTHAFLLRQGVRVLQGDGRTAEARFLLSPDPTAPLIPGRPGRGQHESYLWRMQLGARDADGVLKKTVMPDHFFNWWTHSGKGLVAGPSAATYAERQFRLATDAWRAGDRSAATYHLGAATHLVDDACAPPHEFFLVPHHRAYEDWVLARQESLTVASGGIYAEDFRRLTGHGGAEWSSAHTRGWVDECAHRAAEFVVNTVQPPASGPGDPNPPAGADPQFRVTQRMTAGYLAFFFDSVGGVR